VHTRGQQPSVRRQGCAVGSGQIGVSGIDSGGLTEGGGGWIELVDVSGHGAGEVEREEYEGRMTC
jgi:hypothetical protein